MSWPALNTILLLLLLMGVGVLVVEVERIAARLDGRKPCRMMDRLRAICNEVIR